MNDNPHVRRVAIAILQYLRDHPTAKDSAAGIAKWWVGEEHEVVEKALAFLVKERAIAKQRHVYQIAPNKPPQEAIAKIEKKFRPASARRKQ